MVNDNDIAVTTRATLYQQKKDPCKNWIVGVLMF